MAIIINDEYKITKTGTGFQIVRSEEVGGKKYWRPMYHYGSLHGAIRAGFDITNSGRKKVELDNSIEYLNKEIDAYIKSLKLED